MARFTSKIVGIDLGTTNTLISYYDEIGKRGECCVNQEGTNLIPSAVYFESSTSYTVGTIARESAVIYPEKTAIKFKRKMGISKEAINVDGKVFSPQQVSSLVLKEAIESAVNELEVNVKSAVITVPAYFSSDSRKATIEAGKMAGLDVKDILDEPVAAVYHCDSMNNLKGKTVLVVDLGGGTFDVVAVTVSDTEIDEIAINGNISLGGSDWDLAFVRHIKENYLKRKTLEPDDEQDLLLNAEKAKIALSRKEKTRINVSTRQGRTAIELTRTEFEECTKTLLDKTRRVLQDLMKDVNRQGINSFDKIIMVGGATRMPQVEKMLGVIFPETEIIAVDQDEAVAKGAAVYAKLLSLKSKGKRYSVKKSFKPKLLNRISPRSYGIVALQGNERKRKVCNMIYRSEKLPLNRQRTFYTSCMNQKFVNLRVYETISNEKFLDIDPDAFLGNCIMKIPIDIPEGSEIQVTFTLNENGTLSIEGKEPKSGCRVKATMESKV